MSIAKKLKLNSNENTDEYDYSAESPYFLPISNIQQDENLIANNLLKIELDLSAQLKTLKFKSPVEAVYDPLEYAYLTHSMFVNKYCNNTKKILFLGLNPGPWGMAQTGVPFGEVNITREWLNISGPVNKPSNEISERPVNGFECHRSEVSGKKFWSLFQNLCGNPEFFFKYSYVHNLCPLLLLKKNGSNVTPADLKSAESAELLKLCEESLIKIIQLLKIEIIIGIGRFAEKRAADILKKYSIDNIQVHFLIHPSPIIPKNKDWNEKATRALEELNLLQYFSQ